MDGKLFLQKRFFTEKKTRIFESGEFYADAFIYPTGIEALTLGNSRGYITVLPYMGQMVWDAVFDGKDLTMKNIFKAPRPAGTIVETYGCYLYHSGLLRNGCPGPEDTHALHGEMPCAAMDSAQLIFGGDFIGIAGSFEYAMGFGDHYLATPRVTLAGGKAVMEVSMAVENLAAADMELMYMCHSNPAFEPGAQIIQPAPFTPESVVTRTSIPGHVHPTRQWLDFLEKVRDDPGIMATLDQPENYDPEFVFFLKNLAPDEEGRIQFLMKTPDGPAHYLAYDAKDFSHLTRWILSNEGQQVAAFALPGSCEPEGYAAEKAKGNVKVLGPGEKRRFKVSAGLLSEQEAGPVEATIRALV